MTEIERRLAKNEQAIAELRRKDAVQRLGEIPVVYDDVQKVPAIPFHNIPIPKKK